MNNKFNIGDVVQITDMDGNYTHYSKMAQHMNLDNFMVGENCPTNTNLEIVAAKDHLEFYEVVYGVKDIATGKEYLVGDDFMVLVKPSSQYTLDDLRNKYVRVGTPEFEMFMDACEKLSITWPSGTKPRDMDIDDEHVSFDSFDENLGQGDGRFYISSEEYSLFTPKQPQPVIAEETPWTIYNNTLPMSDLSDDQASQLFVAWRNGDQVLQHGTGVCPRWGKSSIYQIKRKSERDEFVEKALTFTNYKGKYEEQDVAYITGLLYDAGCRFV